jgi:hypothetical protein
MKRFALVGFADGLANQDITPTDVVRQGGFIQDKESQKPWGLVSNRPEMNFGLIAKVH